LSLLDSVSKSFLFLFPFFLRENGKDLSYIPCMEHAPGGDEASNSTTRAERGYHELASEDMCG
jgi:hypothetical protein